MSYEYQKFATLGVNLNRQKYGALDISQVFTSQADLDYYTSKGAVTTGVSEYWYKSATDKVTPYPYAGQYVALVNNTSKVVTAYILQEKEDGTFETKEVGKLPAGDGKTIDVSSEGVVSLKAALPTDSDVSYQLTCKDGVMTWAKVDTTTVSGLQSEIANLNTEVSGIKTTVAEHATSIAANKSATETNAADIEVVEGRLDTVEGSISSINNSISGLESDVAQRYTKTETDQKISDAISATTHLTFEVVEEVSATTITDSNKIYLYKDTSASASASKDVYEEYMLIGGVITKIGSTETDLSGYVQEDQLVAAKSELQAAIDAVEADLEADEQALETFKADVSSTYETKSDASTAHTEINTKLASKADVDTVTALAGRVTAAEGDIDSLEASVKDLQDAGGEPNYIKSVDSEYFEVPATGDGAGKLKLTTKIPTKLSSIDSEIAGVKSTLDTKLNATDLSSSITNLRNSTSGLLSADQEAKLEGITSGAEVNKIETVKVGDAALDVAEDRSVTIPIGTIGSLGVVTSSSENDKVSVGSDGTMTINGVNASKLYQDEDDVLVFDCGQA